jgi:hypothetical protein
LTLLITDCLISISLSDSLGVSLNKDSILSEE